MKADALRRTIDSMVMESIRRILPAVMNEVLIKTIANSGVLSEAVDDDEEAPRRKRKLPKRRKVVREAPKQKRAMKAKPPRKVDLNELLDPTAGADFYGDPRVALYESEEPEYEDEEDDEPVRTSAPMKRLTQLAPELQAMAEGIDLDMDSGEMWGDGEMAPVGGGSGGGASGIVDPNPIRDIDRAAAAVGIDFSRMKGVVAKTTAKSRSDQETASAKAQFEQLRLKRMRENLNGGKPVE